MEVVSSLRKVLAVLSCLVAVCIAEVVAPPDFNRVREPKFNQTLEAGTSFDIGWIPGGQPGNVVLELLKRAENNTNITAGIIDDNFDASKGVYTWSINASLADPLALYIIKIALKSDQNVLTWSNQFKILSEAQLAATTATFVSSASPTQQSIATSTAPSSQGPSNELIAGIVGAGASTALLLCCIGIAYWWIRRRRRQKAKPGGNSSDDGEVTWSKPELEGSFGSVSSSSIPGLGQTHELGGRDNDRKLVDGKCEIDAVDIPTTIKSKAVVAFDGICELGGPENNRDLDDVRCEMGAQEPKDVDGLKVLGTVRDMSPGSRAGDPSSEQPKDRPRRTDSESLVSLVSPVSDADPSTIGIAVSPIA